MSNPKKISAIVTDIIEHDTEVFTVKLKTENAIPRYKPGQFLHLTLDNYDSSAGFWPDSRVFSIASSPQDNFLEISYSVKGVYTKRMMKELTLNKKVWLKLPYGNLIISNYVTESSSITLIAGGTGITPFISFLKHAINNSLNNPITLFYGIRNTQLYLYEDIIEECNRKLNNFSSYLFVEELEVDRQNQFPGRLDVQKIWENLRSPLSNLFFIAGPPGMIEHFKIKLIENHIPENNIIIDEWE